MNKTIHPLLDAHKQNRAGEYESTRRRVSLWGQTASFALSLIFIVFINEHIPAYLPAQPLWQILIYACILILYFLPLEFLQSYISGYRVEHRFGFSNQSFGAFFGDFLKETLLQIILYPLLIGLLVFVMRLGGGGWWLPAAGGMLLVSFIFATLFPVLVLPLFNKYTPIEDPELNSQLMTILQKSGLSISGFFMQDMSRQTKKENAFLAGLGHTRRVVLSDNIMENMSADELETVIAHEAGHYRHKHMWKNLLVSTIFQSGLFFIISRLLPLFSPGYLGSTLSILSIIPIFLLLYSVLSSFILSPVHNAISRRFEYEADAYSLEMTNKPKAFISAMAGLANRNLSNAYPRPFIKFLYYSHPPVGERLEHGETYLREMSRV